MINWLRKIKKIILSIYIKKRKVYWTSKNHFFLDNKNIINYEFIRWAQNQEYSKNLTKDFFVYEKFQSEVFIDLIKSSKTFVDIGCQIGFYSLIANEYDNIKNILCLDVSSECIKATKLNFKNNKKNNKKIIINKDALGPKKINYSFWAENSNGNGKSLDEIIKKDNLILTTKDIIKIDIEGYEYTYFDTIQKYLLQNKPILFFSLHKTFITELSKNKLLFTEIINDLSKIYSNIFYINDHESDKIKINNSNQIPKDNENPVLICYQN